MLLPKVLIALLVIAGGYFILSRYSIGPSPIINRLNPFNNEKVYPDLATRDFNVEIDDHPSYGNILIDERGHALYVFADDGKDVSRCTGPCANEWPPFTVSSDVELEAPEKIQAELATFPRGDGSFQVSFRGQPLYFYSQDLSPGDVFGAGIADWSVVTVESPY